MRHKGTAALSEKKKCVAIYEALYKRPVQHKSVLSPQEIFVECLLRHWLET